MQFSCQIKIVKLTTLDGIVLDSTSPLYIISTSGLTKLLAIFLVKMQSAILDSVFNYFFLTQQEVTVRVRTLGARTRIPPFLKNPRLSARLARGQAGLEKDPLSFKNMKTKRTTLTRSLMSSSRNR